MQKRNNCYLGTLEASLPYTELFGSLSPVYEEEIQEPWLECNLGDPVPSLPRQNSDHSVLDAWELLQEYGDLNCHQDDFPELYDLCVDINDVCGKYESEKKGRTGPTLAELNGRRALSPLINPEMRRLHMEATEFDEPDFILFGSGLREQTEVTEPLKVVTCKNLPPHGGQHCYEEKTKICSRNENSHTFCKTTDRQDFVPGRQCSMKKEPVEQAVDLIKPLPLSAETDDSKRQSFQEAKLPEACEVLNSADEERQHPGSPVKLEEREHTDRETIMESENEDDEDDDDDIDSEDENISRRDKVLMAKGRRSEAEDWTPNPAKLVEIGKQLDRLNRVIGDLRPINQLPLNSRNKTRREKNKLASRACRLKKKAGHEANKIKLRGLEMENSLLLKVVESIKDAVVCGKESISDKGVLKKVDLAMGNCVAGKLTDFVDTVIKKAAIGDSLKGFKHHIKE